MFKKNFYIYIVLIALLCLSIIFSIAIGAIWIPPESILSTLWNSLWGAGSGSVTESVILHIRLPRIIFAIFAGAGLAIAGATLQGLFRNPLADPGLVGVSSGAALGAVFIIVLGGYFPILRDNFGQYSLPLFACISGFVFTFVVYKLATTVNKTDITILLLAGIAVSFLAEAINGILVFNASDAQLRDLTFWRLGSLGRVSWDELQILIPLIIIGIIAILSMKSVLNLLLLGDDEASFLGVDVEYFKKIIILIVALLVGPIVAFSGGISFVGLVVPHLVRFMMGVDYRRNLPACMICGAILMLLADSLSRVIVLPAELPISIVTSLVGVPFFIYLLLKHKRRVV